MTATTLSTPCREWQGPRTPTGYGTSSRAKRTVGTAAVHRWMWILAYGPIPEGSVVLHLCDNPPCFRLDHLVLGTQGDNMRDMAAKGRQWAQRDGARLLRGESHRMSKLTDEQVRAIRRDFVCGRPGKGTRGNARELAARFGVCEATIVRVAQRKSWQHVQDEVV